MLARPLYGGIHSLTDLPSRNVPNLYITLSALTPIFTLILLGAALRRADFPGTGFWPQVERLTYYVFFPALLIGSLATADVEASRIAPMAIAVVSGVAIMTLGLLAARRLIPVNAASFTSVYQGATRFNTFIVVAIAFGVYGTQGGAITALIMALMIPVMNVLCVAMLSHYAGGRTTPAALIGGMARNPLIISCAVGIALNRTGIGLPGSTGDIVEILGRAALPVGLMTVGAGLSFQAVKGQGTALAVAVPLKLLVFPAITWLIGSALGLQSLELQILVLLNATPTATSAYILARQLGGDHRLMATILTVQTIVSAATLPLWLLALGSG